LGSKVPVSTEAESARIAASRIGNASMMTATIAVTVVNAVIAMTASVEIAPMTQT